MALVFNKKLLWLLVIWFALMQSISPFVHGHFELDTPAQGHGLHMHIEGLMQPLDSVHTLKNVSGLTHTVSLDKALIKKVDLIPLPLFAVLFVLCLLLLTYRFTFSSYVFNPRLISSLRSICQPRAPPTFLK